MKGFSKVRVLLAALLIGGLFAVVPSQSASAASSGDCQTVTKSVRLAPLLPKNHTISAQFCTPHQWAEGEHQVDVLIHGASYNRVYWDFPVDYPNYSYVEKTLQAGRATFAYDRLGAGESSRPLSLLLTVQAEAYVLHQLIGSLRSDFGRINVVGHSLGSLVAIEEAATYKGVDKLVLTGFLHAAGPGAAQLVATVVPAGLDPQFAGKGYDPGYVTTGAGQRGEVFYSDAADQSVIDYDESNKDVFALSALTGAIDLLPLINTSARIEAETLLVFGDDDKLFCGLVLDCTSKASVAAHEALYYRKAASLSVEQIINTGHNIALHPSAGEAFGAINQWLTER